MRKIRILTVTFNSVLQPWEIHAFRAAIAKKTGKNDKENNLHTIVFTITNFCHLLLCQK